MSRLILVGDRVLIRPDEGVTETPAGLVLPASVREKERVQAGHVVNVGPGHLIPNPEYSESEPWAEDRPVVRYLPLQAQEGDYAFFLRKEAVEIELEGERHLVIAHGAILALVRPD